MAAQTPNRKATERTVSRDLDLDASLRREHRGHFLEGGVGPAGAVEPDHPVMGIVPDRGIGDLVRSSRESEDCAESSGKDGTAA